MLRFLASWRLRACIILSLRNAICHTPCAKKRLQSVAHVVTMMMEDPSLRTAQETQQTLTEVLLSKAAVLNVSKV